MALNVDTILQIKSFMKDEDINDYTIIFYELINTLQRLSIPPEEYDTFFYDNPSIQHIFSNDVEQFKRIISPILANSDSYQSLPFREKIDYFRNRMKNTTLYCNKKKITHDNKNMNFNGIRNTTNLVMENQNNNALINDTMVSQTPTIMDNNYIVDNFENDLNQANNLTFTEPDEYCEDVIQNDYTSNEEVYNNYIYPDTEEYLQDNLIYPDTEEYLQDNLIYPHKNFEPNDEKISNYDHFNFISSMPSAIPTPQKKINHQYFKSLESQFSTPH